MNIKIASLIFSLFVINLQQANAVTSFPCETIFLKSGSQLQASIMEMYERTIQIRSCENGKKYQIPWEKIDSISNYSYINYKDHPFVFFAESELESDPSNYQRLGIITNEYEDLTLYGNRSNGQIERYSDEPFLNLKKEASNASKFTFDFVENSFIYFRDLEYNSNSCHSFSLLSGKKMEAQIKAVYAESLLLVECNSHQKYLIPYYSLLSFQPKVQNNIKIIYQSKDTSEDNYGLADSKGSFKLLRFILYTAGCLGLLLFWLVASLF